MNLHVCAKVGANWSIRLVVIPDFGIFLPIKPPKLPPGVSRTELFFAYVHTQMNPHMCAKFGANWSIRLVVFQDLLFSDP